MPSQVTARLSAARRQRFVGRDSEKSLFRNLLTAPELPFQVLHVYGPGGVGKTMLLREFTSLAEQNKIPAFYLDARNLEPSPDSFFNALRIAMGLGSADSAQVLAAQLDRRVILIDTYETLAPLDGWLREVFLPQLNENTLVVLADRNPPTPAWRADPGWQTALHVLPLRNLSPDESRAYLTKRNVPPEEHAAVLDFTHGHPLALSLFADVFAQRPGFQFQPTEAPDVIKVLLERFVQKVPGPAHRAALEACVLARLTTESLLAEMLAQPDSRELFEWLRGLSFIQAGPQGLFPHDLAREALAADIRWRNPDWYRELHKRARNYYVTRLQQARGGEQQRILSDYIFLHRDQPVVRSLFQWQESGTAVADALRESDRAGLIQMVAQHEGAASARLADHWLTRQPQNVLVFREPRQPPAGFLALVSLDQTTPPDREIDPGVRAAWDYMQRAPLRPGETATIFRFWMARETYQDVSPIQSLIFINIVRHYLTTPGLAFTFIPCADPEPWASGFAYGDLPRLPAADFQVGGHRYGVYGHDWRVRPPMAWLALMAEREVAGSPEALAPPQSAEPLVVLSQAEFATAVRDALRDLPRGDALHKNPLLRSRIVAQRLGTPAATADRAAALQALLKETIEALRTTPRDAKLYRALYHTYLQPAATQEQAAEALDLPFSTYRRHLKEGIERVVEMLWQQEIGP